MKTDPIQNHLQALTARCIARMFCFEQLTPKQRIEQFLNSVNVNSANADDRDAAEAFEMIKEQWTRGLIEIARLRDENRRMRMFISVDTCGCDAMSGYTCRGHLLLAELAALRDEES